MKLHQSYWELVLLEKGKKLENVVSIFKKIILIIKYLCFRDVVVYNICSIRNGVTTSVTSTLSNTKHSFFFSSKFWIWYSFPIWKRSSKRVSVISGRSPKKCLIYDLISQIKNDHMIWNFCAGMLGNYNIILHF